MTTKNSRLILGGSSLQSSFDLKPTVSAYSDSCRETSIIETGNYNSLKYPDVKLTRLENDASCLKYLQKSFKKQRFKSLFYNTDITLSSESESSSDDSCSSEYISSDDESMSSNESSERTSRVRINKINCKFYDKSKSTKTCWNSCKSTVSINSNSRGEVENKFLKFPIIKLIRLENDENCYKYLNQNSGGEMPEKKTDEKKLSPIVIVTNANVDGKHKTSFMIKKHDEYEAQSDCSEESKDSCYNTSINDSDSSHNSLSNCKKVSRFNLNFNSSYEQDKPSNPGSKACSISLKPLVLSCENLESAEKRNLSLNSGSTPIEIDLISDKSSSSIEEQLTLRCLENRTDSFESNSNTLEQNFSEDESSTSDEIMRCFEPETSQNSENYSNSTIAEGENLTTTADIQENDKTKVYDSGIGITDDTATTMSDDSYFFKSAVVFPNCDNDGSSDGEECFIIDCQFIDDDDFKRLVSEIKESVDSNPVKATCELCNDSFTSRSSLYRHMEQKHNCTNIYECLHCGQIFSVKACLVYHLYAKLNEEDEQVSESHACSKYSCSKENFTGPELEFLINFCSHHSTLHRQLIKTEVPDENQNCTLQVSENTSNGHSTVEEQCSSEIKRESCDIESCIKNDCQNECSESALICLADQNSKHGKLKRRSSSKIYNNIPKKNQKCKDKCLNKYVCHLCMKECSSKKDLFDHFSHCHNHIYYHECQACGKLFQNSICFASHFAKKECVKTKTLSQTVCEICHRSYKSSQILRKHKMNLHNIYLPSPQNQFIQSLAKLPSSDTVFNCVFCYDSYSSLIKLLDHERDSHEYYICFQPLCSEKFFSKSDLERHLFLHIAPGESSFCGFCSKLFFTKAYLENHIKWHLET